MSLRQCLRDSADYEAVHIVPPGVFGTSKFPKTFLVQTVFETLDELLFEENILKDQQKIVLVVDDKIYFEEFYKELQKRYQETEIQNNFSFFEKIKDLWNFEKKGKDVFTSASFTMSVKNNIPATPIIIWGPCEEKMSEAFSALNDELSHIMTKNAVLLQLNEEQITFLENLKSNLKELPVLITFTKSYNESDNYETCQSCTGRNRVMGQTNSSIVKCKHQPKVEITATLKIQGLTDDKVKEYKHILLNL
ncbi:uncharacterized protein LOC131956170 [Physella acuta]|uniref:uncharacterized protein LOC131956170 n=1 Tax=Physella acuta TaxID=109671 RepID=UPI0027DDE80A|nr:uncharacterized protein LOC131956170 [Physella acuta]